MLDLYYHLHDDDKTMMELAKSGVSDLVDCHFEDILRTVGESKINNDTQLLGSKELIDVFLAIQERGGEGDTLFAFYCNCLI
jgi:hypothetical protein